MKQYITVERAERELGDRYEWLIDWLEEHGYRDWSIIKYNAENPMINIGQMIEFLEDKAEQPQIGYDTRTGFPDVELRRWGVELNRWQRAYNEDELCDALWEAVKIALE